MGKIAHYLQEHINGEVTDSLEVRRYFSRDASILQITPSVVVYPADETDVRKVARFSWQLAQRGKRLAITARGAGSDTSGAAIGNGVILAFTAHMNRVLSLDPKKQLVTVEPGITFGALHQTLITHGCFLPPVPASGAYATVGGGLANNSIGEKSVKYGDLAKYVESLSVVLANGEVIDTGPLSKRELNQKMGLSNLEGAIYRAVDALLEESQAQLDEEKQRIAAKHNRVGYDLFNVRQKGKFDLTPLFLGSQGSLGIITEARLRLEEHNPNTDIAVVSLDDTDSLHDILPAILDLKPSACEMINAVAIAQINSLNSNHLKGVLDHPAAALHLIVEFDDEKEGARKKSVKSLKKLAERAGGYYQPVKTTEDKDKVAKLKRSVTALLWQERGGARAVPVAEDLSLPIDRLTDFMKEADATYRGLEFSPVIWGHAGDGVVRMRPVLDLAQTGDRQRMFKLADALYKTAVTMGGSLSASAGDGRIRAPYMGHLYDPKTYEIMMKLKRIFDPHGILNPGVKTATAAEVKAAIRTEYSRPRHDHLHLG